MTEEEERKAHLDRFYELIGELTVRTGGPTPLTMKDCEGRKWPPKGVLFGFEAGEYRGSGPKSPRVVWVASHGIQANSRTTLWKRLRDHLHNDRSNSILRTHIGKALSVLNGGKRASEKRISEHLSKMMVLAVCVPGESGSKNERACIKNNSIGLLSESSRPDLDPPSKSWLGKHCDSEGDNVRESGLWDVRHVGKGYDPCFLNLLAERIDSTEPL